MIVFVDECGCASLASSVLACAVAIESDFPKIDGVKDSKQLSRQKREELYKKIVDKVTYSIGTSSPNRIEKMNIHYAKYYAMKIAVDKLADKGIKIDEVIVDGSFKIPNLSYNQKPVIKADVKFFGCSMASIVGKVTRDRYMEKLSKLDKYSYYKWESNSAYYTEDHRNGIILHGPTKLHRINFLYFKYCLFCHEKYNEFIAAGKTFDEYLEYEKLEESKNNKSFYTLWKEGSL